MRLDKTAALIFGATLLIFSPMSGARGAEYGTGPWVKGYTDIFGGVLPSQPGFYFRGDAYHYNGNADATIFDGRVAFNVDQDYTATLMALTYVTPWNILGGTYAIAVVPSAVAMDVNVGIQIPAFTGPRGRTFGSILTPAIPSFPKATRPSPRPLLVGMQAISIGTSACSVLHRPASTTRGISPTRASITGR